MSKEPTASRPLAGDLWRHLIIGVVIVGSLGAMLMVEPFAQDQAYHQFADRRSLFGIPNFGDVSSNVGFLIAGVAGLIVVFTRRSGPLTPAWVVTFAGIFLVGIASSYYHWTPNDYTLVWDRMSLTVGFMGLFIALLGEYLDVRLGKLLWPAVIAGVGSVIYWNQFQDLRLYYWVQLVPLLVLPFLILLYPARYSRGGMIFVGALFYGLAKLTELGDKAIFAATREAVSGHTMKHILASVGCLAIAAALKLREPVRQIN